MKRIFGFTRLSSLISRIEEKAVSTKCHHTFYEDKRIYHNEESFLFFGLVQINSFIVVGFTNCFRKVVLFVKFTKMHDLYFNEYNREICKKIFDTSLIFVNFTINFRMI